MIKLRPNQQKGFNDLSQLIRDGKRRIIAVAPPGYGKTTLFSAIVASAVSKGKCVVIAIHKKELVDNAVDRLKKQFGIEAGVIMSGRNIDKKKLVQVGSIQTMIRRDLSWLKPDLYMVDEGHRLLTGSHLKMYDEWVCPDKSKNPVPMIIWTATPVRTDKKKKFEDYCDALIQLSTYRQEMENRNLVDTKVYYPKGTASLEGVKIRMSFGEKDYDQEELSKRFSEERILKGLYAHWKKYANGMSTMAFCVDKKHNIASYEYFKSQGVNCAYVDEETPPAERERIVSKFKKGPFTDNPITVLFNIGLFTEGLDAEFTKCILLNYATKSFTKYVQSAARGSRPCWNADYTDWLRNPDGRYYKEKVIILDFGGNTVAHGMLPDYDMFGFDLSGQKKKGEAPVKTCPECREIIYASYQKCPSCEYIFPVEKKKDTKKYSDEVEMEEANTDKHLQKLILGMSQEQIWTCNAGYLRVIALTKGYQPSWCYHVLRDRGEYLDGDEKAPNDWAAFYKYLASAEKMKGMASVYDRMKGRQISK